MRKFRAFAWLSLAALSMSATAAGPASPFPKGYEAAYAAYLTALSPADRKLTWLTRLNQVASPARPLKMGATSVQYMFGCKAHACDTDQANVFLLPDRKKVMAVIKVGGVQKLIGGAGPKEVACVKTLDASGGAAPTC
ncbi:Ivy family c-type lysozyme inhibitor [Sphingobium nicotianae]|uniref:C-lysozyme inhibitor n=1 Tax=Sphingobium nicotianae TaxID=2782607 RepID=A0A9X1IPP4_9SPHN|nr:Ivy family c-type lysozyme inhibitor [Sphingobium nicotianae]MBT2185985.1 hypothetical protein [Sphingobium nicotianae]